MTTIQTFTGRMVDVANLQVTDIDPRDIARALSNICRFTGHAKSFYSVAEHSVHCATRVPEFLKVPDGSDARLLTNYAQRMALLHDAHEAYLGDVSTPVKDKIGWAFHELANPIDCRIRERFGLFTLPRSEDAEAVREAVKAVDQAMLATERLQVFEHRNGGWILPVPAIEGMDLLWELPEGAMRLFLNTFEGLMVADAR